MLSTRSVQQHWAGAATLLDGDREFDLSRDVIFSRSGIELFIELQIDVEGRGNADHGAQTSGEDHTILQVNDCEDDATEGLGGSRQSGSFEYDADDPDAVEDEKNCDDQPPSEVADRCGAAAEPDTNWTQFGWPEWGEPLPPDEGDDDMEIDQPTAEGQCPTSKNAVTLFDSVTFVEPGSLQEGRGTTLDGFSKMLCSQI